MVDETWSIYADGKWQVVASQTIQTLFIVDWEWQQAYQVVLFFSFYFKKDSMFLIQTIAASDILC